MSSIKNCLFCDKPLESNPCTWCGFDNNNKNTVTGVLPFGSTLNSLVIANFINADGEGIFYLAYDKKTQKKVIVKEFFPATLISSRDNDNRIIIQQSKEVLFKNLMMDFVDLNSELKPIEHSAMQKVYDIFYANNTAYCVLEYIKGYNLSQTLVNKAQSYTFKEARWLLNDLFELIQLLNNKQISHGGICDENIIITPDQRIVLTNFSIQDLRTQNQHIIYKLYEGFSAPEQYEIGKFQGFYTDIYSLACVLFYLVTAHHYKTENDLSANKLFPKYAITALSYALKENPTYRIDNIQDFVLMLDNQAVIEQPKTKTQKDDWYKILFDKKNLPIITISVIFFTFIACFNMLNSSNTQVAPEPSITPTPVIKTVNVPNLKGKQYSDVINDVQLQNNFYFVMEEVYDSHYQKGEVVSHEPAYLDNVKSGTTIYLKVSKGNEMIAVPSGLIGDHVDNITPVLDAMGIKYTVIEIDQTEDHPYGEVVRMDKSEGDLIDKEDTSIILYVANNKPLATPTPSPTPTPTNEP